MKKTALILTLLPALALAAGPQHFTLQAAFVAPAKSGADGAVSVTFSGKDPDIHINETPAPRLKLEASQTLLVDKQPPAPRIEPFDPETARYLDLALPVTFPVAFAKDAPRGAQTVAASVTYYYCSKREGWCRKGTTDIAFAANVP